MSKRTSTAGETPHDVKLPVITLALEKILVDESKNLRRFNPDAKAVEELAMDILQNGMINPVLVKPITDADANGFEYELVAGYQRMKSLAYLRDNGNVIESVSASVVEISADEPQKSKILNLKENLRRSDISYIDSAYAIRELQEAGMTSGDIAKEFKKSGAWVSYVSKLLTLRPEIQKKIHSGAVNFRLAKTLPDLTEEEQDAAIAQLESGSTGSGVATAAKAKKPRKNKRGKKAKEDQTENRNLSSKQAVLLFEEKVEELAQVEGKKSKGEENAIELYGDLVRFLTGSIGIKALHNRIVKVL